MNFLMPKKMEDQYFIELEKYRKNSNYEERRASENETKRILRGRVGRM